MAASPEFYQIRSRAIAAVTKAKQTGQLPYLRGDIKCTDCNAPAQVYDHRDYSTPLAVEPVCQKCNIKRGRAYWPSDLHCGAGI